MKKQLAIILVAAMLTSTALSGCTTNSDKGTTSTGTTKPSSTTTESKTEERPMEGNLYLTGRPLVKEQETFTMFCDDNGLPEEKILYPMLEEQTNVKVELQLFPYDAAKEKKNVLLNSGDYPDVMGGWILSDTDILTQGMQEKVYIPLSGLFEKYAPKMMEVLEVPGVRTAITLPDGEIYTIPYVVGEPAVTFLPWINEKWLKAVNLPMPTTTEEFRTVLKAFKTQDPNGNGKADEIPFSGDPNNLALGTLAGWFGVNASFAGVNKYFAMVEGKLDFGPNKEGYKEFIKYFASLNKDGLLDTELFTQDSAQFEAKSKQLVYGCAIGYGSFGDKTPLEIGKTEYDPLPVLKSDFAPKPIFRRNSYGSTLFRTQLVITDKAKNPATIVRWWNNMFEFDNSILTNQGPLGYGIEKVDETTYRSLDTSGKTEAEKTKYNWGNIWTQSLPKYVPVDYKILPAVGVEAPYDEKKTADALYEPFLDETVPTVWVDAEFASKQATMETDINNYVLQKQAEWISGKKDVNAEWDAYVAQLDKLGLPELLKMRGDAVAKALAVSKK